MVVLTPNRRKAEALQTMLREKGLPPPWTSTCPPPQPGGAHPWRWGGPVGGAGLPRREVCHPLRGGRPCPPASPGPGRPRSGTAAASGWSPSPTWPRGPGGPRAPRHRPVRGHGEDDRGRGAPGLHQTPVRRDGHPLRPLPSSWTWCPSTSAGGGQHPQAPVQTGGRGVGEGQVQGQKGRQRYGQGPHPALCPAAAAGGPRLRPGLPLAAGV